MKIFNKQIECIKTELIKKDGEDRKYPVNIEGTNFNISVDYVISAIGSKTNDSIINKLNIKTNKWGYIDVDKNFATSNYKIYAIGDLAGTKQTVAWAAKSGFDCAKYILEKK